MALARSRLRVDPGVIDEQADREQGPLEADAVVSDADNIRLHVEFQSDKDPTIGLRMARYFLALVDHHQGPPPEQHLVLLHRRADHPRLGSYTLGTLSLRYQVTRLWQIDPERLLARVGLAGFASLARAETLAERAELLVRAGRVIRAGLPRDRAASALMWAAALATLHLESDVVEDLLRRNDMSVDLSNSYLAIRSREEGLREGQREMISRALDGRFGDPALTERVSEIPDERLLDAIDRAVAADADAFTAWLDQL